MKLLRSAGVTSEIWQIFVRDSSNTAGAGLTGLVFNSGSLTAYYHRNTDTTATAITLATMTVGTFTSSGFKEIDATNMPGWYQFCPPNAALASGASSCAFWLGGAANMAPVPFEVDLNGQAGITSNRKKGVTCTIEFPGFSSTTGALTAGLTFTTTISKDGGAQTATSNAATGIGNGQYQLVLTGTEMTANNIFLIASATGAVTYSQLIQTQP